MADVIHLTAAARRISELEAENAELRLRDANDRRPCHLCGRVVAWDGEHKECTCDAERIAENERLRVAFDKIINDDWQGKPWLVGDLREAIEEKGES